jgi:hypothetical protein
VAHGLRRLPGIRLDRLAWTADFAIWATTREIAFWPSGTFARAYEAIRRAAVESVIDRSGHDAADRRLVRRIREGAPGREIVLTMITFVDPQSCTKPPDDPSKSELPTGTSNQESFLFVATAPKRDLDPSNPLHQTLMRLESAVK